MDLPKEAKQLLQDGMSPREFLTALLEKQKYLAAIDFMAHAFEVREGLWWGCLCMQHALGDHLAPPDRAAAIAAVRWLMKPTEENRAAAKAPGEAAGPMSPAGALAAAVGLTGGSVYPPELPFKPPEPFAAHEAIARAVTLASIKGDPKKIVAAQRSYVELAIAVAEGQGI
jgi:hypothetical protein